MIIYINVPGPEDAVLLGVFVGGTRVIRAGSEWYEVTADAQKALDAGEDIESIKKKATRLAGNKAKKLDEEYPICEIICFPPGTLVLMADGSTKQIEDIEPGDLVLSDDPNDDEGAAAHEVTAVHAGWTERLIEVSLDFDGDGAVDDSIRATGFHPVWTEDRGWQFAQDLCFGDRLRGIDAGTTHVIRVAEFAVISDTFNLSVSGCRTYFVVVAEEAILVHNRDAGELPKVKKPIGFDEHHVIEKGHPRSEDIRRLMEERFGEIDWKNDKRNKIWMDERIHHRLHTDSYRNELFERLRSAENVDEMWEIIHRFRKELANNPTRYMTPRSRETITKLIQEKCP